jgi:hypothetical protein
VPPPFRAPPVSARAPLPADMNRRPSSSNPPDLTQGHSRIGFGATDVYQHNNPNGNFQRNRVIANMIVNSSAYPASNSTC